MNLLSDTKDLHLSCTWPTRLARSSGRPIRYTVKVCFL